MNIERCSPRRLLGITLLALGTAPGCEINRYHYTSIAAGGGGPGSAGAAGLDPYSAAPETTTTPEEQSLDLFGVVGNRFWLAVSEDQLELINAGLDGGGGPIFDLGDLYTPGGTTATYVDHLFVTTPGDDPSTADYGKVEVRLAGQSTLRAWSERSIPTLRIDMDEFSEDLRLAGFEHLRLNNGQVGSIFREKLTLDLYRELGVPAPLAAFAWVESNVWGPDVAIPYTLVEVYKSGFCQRHADAFGGGCVNMWEFVGDFAMGEGGPIPIIAPAGDVVPREPGFLLPSVFDDPNNCQLSTCEATRVKELEQLISVTPSAEGFKAALAGFIDWDAYHRFQCLAWVLATGDDAVHGQNNVVIVERGDGLFQYLPYSVDISLGQEWYFSVPLVGTNRLSTGCQADPTCWADTIATCEQVIAEFAALDPVERLEAEYDALAEAGMLRDGDVARYEQLRSWFEQRLLDLPLELEQYRETPGACQLPLIDCGGWCAYPEECGGCVPPPGGEPLPVDGAAGAAGAGGVVEPPACEPIPEYPVY